MDRPHVGAAFDAINDAFHDAYDRAVTETSVAPLLVVLGDVLVVRRARERSEEPITPPVVHVIKSLAHLPIALFAIGSAPDAVRALRERVEECANAIADATTDAEVGAIAKSILDACRALIESGAVDDARLSAFAREMGPCVLRATDAATRIQLAALDEATATVLDAMTADERRTFEVIVAGEHQARARNLPMQYFAKLLGEAPEEDERVAYAEGAKDEAEAVLLAGKRHVDRRLAVAFFGDEKRLQRDVLGDAAKTRLEHFTPRARL